MIDKPLKATEMETMLDQRGITRKGNVYTIKRGFYYANGNSAYKIWDRVEARLSNLGFKFRLVDRQDVWATWPRDSYFLVKFEVHEFPTRKQEINP